MRESFYCIAAICGVLLTCSHHEPINPFDPKGTNWNPPTLAAMADTVVAINDTVYLHASGSAENGYIAGYEWSFDPGKKWTFMQMEPFEKTWGLKDTGAHLVFVRAVDSAGVVSDADSFIVQVRSYAPVVVAMNDMSVAINDSICLHAQGSDTNGVIKGYRWSSDGGTTWTSNGQTLCRQCTARDTGAWKILVRVIDDDSILSNSAAFTVSVRLYAPIVAAMKDTSVNINDSITITAAGKDSNGTVVKYIWAGNGGTYSDTTTAGIFKTAWPDSGKKILRMRSMDNDGVLSEPDTCVVKVTLDPPILSSVKDTTVHQYDTVRFVPSARDANPGGSIVRYLLGRGANGWDDSSSVSGPFSIANPAGGTLKVIWGARDDDGLVTADTFAVFFNRPPTVASVVAPSDNVSWTNYNYSSGAGDLMLKLEGKDPDGLSDTLTYQVLMSKAGSALASLYEGKDTIITATKLDTNTDYAWKITAKDRFGDSTTDTGSFITPGAPALLEASAKSLSPSCVQNSDASNDTFYVWNMGSGRLEFTINDTSSWLACAPTSGASTGPGDKRAIVVTYTTQTLALGTYYGTITVSSGEVQKKISVTLLIAKGPTMCLSDSMFTETCIESVNPASRSFSLFNGGAGKFSYTLSDNVAWLSCDPDTGTISGSVSNRIAINYAVDAISAGTYTGTITVSSQGFGSRLITVKLTVLKQPTPEVDKTAISAISSPGANAATDSFMVWNSGAGTLNFFVSDTMAWLTCVPANGTSTGPNDKKKISVIYSTDILTSGMRNGSIAVKSISNRGDTLTRVITVRDTVRQEWTKATSAAAFSGRCNHTTVAFDNKLWVIGGWTSLNGSVYNDVWYSTDGINWTQATSAAAFGGRCGHTSVVFDNKMWVISGSSSSYFSDVWYSTDGMTWTQATPSAAFGGRDQHTSVVFDNKMWVIGGQTYGGLLNDVWYSSDGITWTQATSAAAFGARYDHTSVAFDNKMWVIGGSSLGTYGGYTRNDVWYSSDGITWTQATSAAAFGARYGPTSVVFDNKMWLIAGCGPSPIFSDVWYSSDGITWTQMLASAPFGGRVWPRSVIFDNKMWVIGGSPSTYSLNDVWYAKNK